MLPISGNFFTQAVFISFILIFVETLLQTLWQLYKAKQSHKFLTLLPFMFDSFVTFLQLEDWYMSSIIWTCLFLNYACLSCFGPKNMFSFATPITIYFSIASIGLFGPHLFKKYVPMDDKNQFISVGVPFILGFVIHAGVYSFNYVRPKDRTINLHPEPFNQYFMSYCYQPRSVFFCSNIVLTLIGGFIFYLNGMFDEKFFFCNSCLFVFRVLIVVQVKPVGILMSLFSGIDRSLYYVPKIFIDLIVLFFFLFAFENENQLDDLVNSRRILNTSKFAFKGSKVEQHQDVIEFRFQNELLLGNLATQVCKLIVFVIFVILFFSLWLFKKIYTVGKRNKCIFC